MQSTKERTWRQSPYIELAPAFSRAYGALSVAEVAVGDLADAIDNSGILDAAPDDTETWRREAFRQDLEAVLGNLATGSALIHGESPGVCDPMPAEELAKIPPQWRERVDRIPAAALYLQLLRAASQLRTLIDSALSASVHARAFADTTEAPDFNGDVQSELEDALRCARRSFALIGGDVASCVPPILRAVAGIDADAPPTRLCSCELPRPDVCV